MFNEYDEDSDDIYMKVMKKTMMVIPIMVVSDLKIIQKTLLFPKIRCYIFCCCLPDLFIMIA